MPFGDIILAIIVLAIAWALLPSIAALVVTLLVALAVVGHRRV